MLSLKERDELKKKLSHLSVKDLQAKQKAALKEYDVEGNIPLDHEYWVIRNVLRAK